MGKAGDMMDVRQDRKDGAALSRSHNWRENRILTLLAVTGVVFFFLQFLSPLFSPILIAMLFVTIFGPLLKKMQEKFHIHRQIGAVILLLAAGFFFVVLVWVLLSWMIGSLPGWVGRLEELEKEVRVFVYNGCQLAGHALRLDGNYLSETVLGYVEKGFDQFQEKAVPGMFMQSLEYVKGLAVFGGFLVTFLIAAVLLAKDYDRIMNSLLDREEYHVILEVICGVIRYIATFVKAQFVIMSAIAALSALVLTFSGIEYGALWGLLAGVLDALPFIGTGVVLVPLALMRLFYGNVVQAVLCLVLYGVCGFLREFLEPRLIGGRFGVPPIAVLISVYAGIRLFGLWGILKGPLGFVMIYQTYLSLTRRYGKDGAEEPD